MNVNILCIGKVKESFYREALAEYAKRLGRFCKFTVTELPEDRLHGSETGKVVEGESNRLAAKIKGVCVLADIGGELITSEGLAAFIADTAVSGVSDMTFVIGGSHGVSDGLRGRADKRVSFGRVTYPHQLMRVILAEQIYRAFMINEGSEYHK